MLVRSAFLDVTTKKWRNFPEVPRHRRQVSAERCLCCDNDTYYVRIVTCVLCELCSIMEFASRSNITWNISIKYLVVLQIPFLVLFCSRATGRVYMTGFRDENRIKNIPYKSCDPVTVNSEIRSDGCVVRLLFRRSGFDSRFDNRSFIEI